MAAPELRWLPIVPDWRPRLQAAERLDTVPRSQLVALAEARLDALSVDRLDRLLQRQPAGSAAVRLAVLGSSTTAHLLAPLRVAGLRRDMHIEVYEGEYGQYAQALLDSGSTLHRFAPTAVLLALDARHLTQGIEAAPDAAAAAAVVAAAVDRLRMCWRQARTAFRCTVIQQAVLPVLPAVLGQNEARWPGSPAAAVTALNAALRAAAEVEGVHVLALDTAAAQDGIAAWHNPIFWHRAKQEVSPAAAPMYGELAARLLAAQAGRSAKCLVMDLDDTLWGGVIGDVGLDGIVLGQGDPLGEAFAAVQAYALALARRGVILAVCSKNDEANALAAFEQHPEMLLRREDIACFVANWDDKATNLRRIAQALNIGLDAIVFLDDNPFERNLVRAALPQVMVPEIPGDDPAGVPGLLAAAGYFESLGVTDDDRARTAQYRANEARAALVPDGSDLASYLRGLDMRLVWRRFDRVGLPRIVQLINKTNQFNLTTRRYTEAEVHALMEDSGTFGLQFRLLDRFGDNGMIAVVIGRMNDTQCVLDTWLMSCRVLGRQVEHATLAVVAAVASGAGATALVGEYRPTAKNAMVAGHYAALGFAPDGEGRSLLPLDGYVPAETCIRLEGDPP